VLYLALLAFIGVIPASVAAFMPSCELVQNARQSPTRCRTPPSVTTSSISASRSRTSCSAPSPGAWVPTTAERHRGRRGRVLTICLTFYFLLEADTPSRAWCVFPGAPAVDRRTRPRVSAWLTGQLLLGGTSATPASSRLAGVPHALVLALIAAVGELIPVVGPLLAAIPAIAVAFSVSPSTALMVTVFFFIQQQIENNVLVPKIMEKQVGVSAITVMIALMIGASLQGIIGALLAVPTAAIVQVVVQDLLQYADDIAVTDV
jgi:hypothetical protein